MTHKAQASAEGGIGDRQDRTGDPHKRILIFGTRPQEAGGTTILLSHLLTAAMEERAMPDVQVEVVSAMDGVEPAFFDNEPQRSDGTRILQGLPIGVVALGHYRTYDGVDNIFPRVSTIQLEGLTDTYGVPMIVVPDAASEQLLADRTAHLADIIAVNLAAAQQAQA